MYSRHVWTEKPNEAAEADRQTASLAAMAVILLLLVAGLFRVHELRSKASIEDCLMSGRRSCDRLVGGQS